VAPIEVELLRGPVSQSDVTSINTLLGLLNPTLAHWEQPGLSNFVAFCPNTWVFVAYNTHGGVRELVGMVTLTMTSKLSGINGHVDDLVVKTDFLRQGVAEKLMRHLIEYAGRLNIKLLELTSHAKRTAAHFLYLKLGFEKRETNVFSLTISA
jgi:ribosomal protein S18 acetylase RimI-like enzyme